MGGFDVIVGNPPFAGKNTLINANADAFPDWLKEIHPGSHGNADLVAHFFRQAFNLIRPCGCFGLIATNTIGQGDTRSTGLRWICQNGGTIYRATKRLKWPGEAAVIVSVVHVCRGTMQTPYILDRREVDRITAYLFHAGGNDDPARLEANADKSFQGYILLGMGFTFDDTEKKGIATSLVEMERLIGMNPRNRERIFPFIGYEEVASNPTHAHHRYVINFEDFPLMRLESGQSWVQLAEDAQRVQLQKGIVAPDYPGPVAADWPELLAIVREKVKPERDRQKRDANRERWWQYAEKRPGLRSATRGLARVIVAGSQASTHYALAFLPQGLVYSSNLSVLVLDTYAAFAILQSRVHEAWARFFMSTMKDDLAYTPTTCFEPFPFPQDWPSDLSVEIAGKSYDEFRAALMVKSMEGLTDTYNRFHDPDESPLDIVKLRELHDAMDRAILDAYRWTDIQPKCEFIPEFDDEDEDDEMRRPRKKKYRYRWPDETRNEVLARLLDLNRQRALEEGQSLSSGAETALPPDSKSKGSHNEKSKTKETTQDAVSGLFAVGQEEA
jgi:hypothetical protein